MLKDLITTDTATPEKCTGCGTSIRDRFYLLVADRAWHGQCLRCCKCLQNLDTELSCFAKDGNIYCKDDYFRLFSARRCARCGTGISSKEYIMRAKDLIFHVNCFSCTLCGMQLRVGNKIRMRDGQVFCGDHYDTDVASEDGMSPFYQTNAQKGRPRKRKSNQDDLNSHDQIDRDTPLRLDLLHKELSSGGMDLSSYDGSQSPGSGGTLTPNCRTKRMRTSFKHHQLRTMKSYFAINQNPDAKDLKQLAQKTGLSKRVLQVWFQNARAKWRRNVMRQEGGLGNPQGLNGLPSLQQALHSANSSNQGSDASDITHSSQVLEEMHNMSTFAELY